MNTADDRDDDFAALLSHDEWPLRWQRKVRLAPLRGLGLGRRALFFGLVAWLPAAVWAFVRGHALPGADPEPLLGHFGITVRCLVAIPLMILAEGTFMQVTHRVVRQFAANDLIPPQQRSAFVALLHRVAGLRDSARPWLIVLAIAIAGTLVAPADATLDSLSWAREPDGRLGFGGIWFAYVARPIFLTLLLSWLWRIVIVFVLFGGIAKLDLQLVPSHPDRAGGLGFVEVFPGAFGLVTLAAAAVVGSGWAHDIVYHGESVESLVRPLAVFATVWTLILLAPLLMFMPKLTAEKRQAKEEYGRLVGEHGRDVRKRWILGDAVSDERLDPPGIGPVADAVSLYEAVLAMRPAPIGRASLISVLLPIAIPMLAVFAIQIPIKTLLMKLVKVLV